jgi:hypothetical protein
MMKSPAVAELLGRGVYGASEALRLVNFRRQFDASTQGISRQTIARWLRGYDYIRAGEKRHSTRSGGPTTATTTIRSN